MNRSLSVKIVYMIGNGFDINLGLDTCADGIVRAYGEDVDKRAAEDGGQVPPAVSLLRKNIAEKGIRQWSSFETQLGVYTGELEVENDPADSFKVAFDDFRGFLVRKLEVEEKRADKTLFDGEAVRRFYEGTIGFLADGLRLNDSGNLSVFTDKPVVWDFSFLTFNYTHPLDYLVEVLNADESISKKHLYSGRSYTCGYQSPIHVHGLLEDGDGIIVGVNDESQVKGVSCRGDEDLLNRFVKPKLNGRLGTLRDDKAIRAIQDADLICIYGMSLGETDRAWWHEVARSVSNPNKDTRLVIACLLEEMSSAKPESRPDRADEILDSFVSLSGLKDDDLIERLEQRTMISFNSKAFDLGVDIKVGE